MAKPAFMYELNKILNKFKSENGIDIKFEKLILVCKLMCEHYSDGFIENNLIEILLQSTIDSKEIIITYHPDKIHKLYYLNEFIIKFGGA